MYAVAACVCRYATTAINANKKILLRGELMRDELREGVCRMESRRKQIERGLDGLVEVLSDGE